MNWKLAVIIFLLGFIFGTTNGKNVMDWIYFKIAEIKSVTLGKPPVIINKDYILIKKVNNTLYLYLDIEKPINTILKIPLNYTMNYLYNISDNVEAFVSGNPNYINILIRHKKPILA